MLQSEQHGTAPDGSRLRAVSLSAGFLLTGVATALLGAVLPVLLREWRITDGSGGTLLLLAWGGSTCGALLCRGNLRVIAAAGMALTACAMFALAGINRAAALPLFGFYGLGMGVTMTAINMLSSRQASEPLRRRALMRLNLLWSIGACLSPTLATHALTFTRTSGLFASVGVVFSAVATAIALNKGEPENFAPAEDDQPVAMASAPVMLFAMAALAVGVESAVGGWLTTYASRTAHTELVSISATTAFWAGLLLSRGMHSIGRLQRVHGARFVRGHAVVAVIAAFAILGAPHRSAVFLPSALLAGFGLGPIYPQVLSQVLGTYKPRAIFIVAGVGAAALPWLTGAVSHTAGSLRVGLLVPCVGALLLMVLMLAASRRPRAAKV